jgi:hypothetical protein
MSKATFSNGTSNTGIVKKIGARVVQKALSLGKDLALDLSDAISSRSRAKLLSRTAEKGFSGDKSLMGYELCFAHWTARPHLFVECDSVFRSANQGDQKANQSMKRESMGIGGVFGHIGHDQL